MMGMAVMMMVMAVVTMMAMIVVTMIAMIVVGILWSLEQLFLLSKQVFEE